MVDVTFPKIDLTTVKGVMVDLDDTLYSYETIHPKALFDVFQKFSFNLSFDSFSELYRHHRELVTKRLLPQGACRSRLLAFQSMVEETGMQAKYEAILEMENLYWNGFYSRMSLFPSAKTFLDSCFDLSLPVAVVTDMTAGVQIRKLKALGILDNIFCLVTSEEVGAEKPFRNIFETALRKLSINPESAVFIGDSKEKDFEGASRLGIKAYLVGDSNK
ncbi:HAD family hydrolase [bacterium]|nr:HAD family hydrolase [bacterium]